MFIVVHNAIQQIDFVSQDRFVSFLNNTISRVQKECGILSDLKRELEKFIERLTIKDIEINDCVILNSCKNKNESCSHGMSDKLINCIEIISSMYVAREKEIKIFNEMIKEGSYYIQSDSKRTKSNVDNIEQFKFMDEFRLCTVEAQAATEDIREEINIVTSTFNSQHQNHEELSKIIISVRDCLTKTQEGLLPVISKLKLQENERSRYCKRILNGEFKLKSIKDNNNHIQLELSRFNIKQENVQKSEHMDIHISNDLLAVVTEEIEQILSNMHSFQTQDDYTILMLKELSNQLYNMNDSLKVLQSNINKVLINHEIAKTTFCEHEGRLTKLEGEIDCAHTKMQDVLETSFSIQQIEEEEEDEENEIKEEKDQLKSGKTDFHELRKDYDHLKLNNTQQTEKLNKWKDHIIDLEEQIRVLQHEIKCKQETNNILKNNIQYIEKEASDMKVKAENCKQQYTKDSMELQQRIIELENTIQMQKKIEGELRKSLDSQATFKKLAELSIDHGIETIVLHSDYPSKHEDINQVLSTLKEAVFSADMLVQSVDNEFKRLIYNELPDLPVLAKSDIIASNTLKECKEKLGTCTGKLSKLESALHSKEKLLGNMEQVIRIQQNSLTMSQSAIKDLQEELQGQIDKHKLTISQYKIENTGLLRQNKLQNQTIGHLQNAVVEAKRNLDQMGHRLMNDVRKRDETIRQLTIIVDETQDQYNECFIDATNQDLLLDLHRDGIDKLHKRIHHLQRDRYLIGSTLNTIHYSILNIMQERIHNQVKHFEELKWKMDNSLRTNNYQVAKCVLREKMPNDADQKVEDANNASSSYTTYLENKNGPQDLKYFVDKYTRARDQCSDLDLDDEAKTENIAQIQCLRLQLQKLKDIENDLRDQNQLVRVKLQYHLSETENLMKRLNFIARKPEFQELALKIIYGQTEIRSLNSLIANSIEIMRSQSNKLEALEKRLIRKDEKVENSSELYISEYEILGILCDRINSIKFLLQEKLNNMVKLQADYELLKNENSILKRQSYIIESSAKEEICKLKKKIEDMQLKLCQTESNYQRVIVDLHKTQKHLMLMIKQEADIKTTLIATENEYTSKIAKMENEAIDLRNVINKLQEQLVDARKQFLPKNFSFCQVQDKCKSYAECVNITCEDFNGEKDELMKTNEINTGLIRQLQKYAIENYRLSRQKILLEKSNSAYVAELQNMDKSLVDLKKENHLKDKSLKFISANFIEAVISRSKLCKESVYIVSCVRDCMEQQRKCNKTLVENLKNKQQRLKHLVIEKRALLIKIGKLKRLNLLVPKWRKMYRPLKKVYLAGCISPSDILQNTIRGKTSSMDCTRNVSHNQSTPLDVHQCTVFHGGSPKWNI